MNEKKHLSATTWGDTEIFLQWSIKLRRHYDFFFVRKLWDNAPLNARVKNHLSYFYFQLKSREKLRENRPSDFVPGAMAQLLLGQN